MKSVRQEGKNTWEECVKQDLHSYGLKAESAKDRV